MISSKPSRKSLSQCQSVITLQCFWRRTIAIRHLHRLSIEKRAATLIQAAIRSMLLRCWLKRWLKKRLHSINLCQAHLRRRIAARRWREQKELEYKSARYIQGHVRIYLAKCKIEVMKQVHAATIIISYFRCVKTRTCYTLEKKSMYATKIQALLRVHLSKRIYNDTKNQKIGATKEIQRIWRGFLARKLCTRLLNERCNESWQNQIKLFDSEIQYHVSILDGFHCNESLCANTLRDCDKDIWECEKRIEKFKIMLAQLTPESVQQGWKEQLERNVADERTSLTKKKVTAIFDTYREVVSEQKQMDKQQNIKNDLEKKVKMLQQWKHDVVTTLETKRKQKESSKSEHAKRQAIADEKRAWAVHHFAPSGKPLKTTETHKERSVYSKLAANESREKTWTNLLKMQTYFALLSQLENAFKKPLRKMSATW